jgi:hypothetical protein
MATTEDDLKRFSQFVHDQMRNNTELQLPELFDLWMLQNASTDDYAENVAAINASIGDFLNGDRGTPAGEHSRELRREFGVE